MKKILALAALLSLPLVAQEAPTHLENIFNARKPGEFQKAIAAAKAAGVSQQAILEAKFLFYVDTKNLKAIAALSPELIQQAKKFKPQDSEIFALEEDWLAVVEYSKAIDALLKNNYPDFEKHIKEAFWLSPRQASAFAPHIEQLRMEKAMEKLVIPQDTKLTNLITDKAQTLTAIREENKATLLHFWSPWSRESVESFQDFIATSEAVTKNKINVISVLVDDPASAKKDALDFIKENAPNVKCFWAIDQKKSSLVRPLRITDTPTFVLISSSGKILFNGHPSDQNLWKELKILNPNFTRPQPTPTQP